MDLDDQRAPKGVIKALCRLVDHVDQKLLMENAPRQYLQRHRRIPKNAPVLRKNIKAAVNISGGNDDLINVFLRCASTPEVQAVRMLSKEFMTRYFVALSNSYGRPEFLAACLLDERKEVHELVHLQSEEWIDAIVSEEDQTSARATLSKEWSSFQAASPAKCEVSATSVQAQAEALPSTATDPTRMVELRTDKQAAAIERKFEKKLEKLQKRLEKKEEAIAGHRLAEKAARERAKQLQEDKEVLARRIDALEREVGERISSAIAKALSLETWRWLAGPREIEAANAAAEASSLPAVARALLARQQAQDRHYGNIQEIREKIEERLGLIRDLEHAQATALKPLAEITPTIANLQDEVFKLRHKAEDQAEAQNQVVRQLLARINGIASPAALCRIRSFANEAASIAILMPDHHALIEQALDRKHQRLIEPYGVPLSPSEEATWGACYPLVKAVQSRDPCMVFVDGHNVLLRLRDLFEQYFEAGRAAGKARGKLSHMILRIFGRTSSEVALYFDGADPGVDVLSEKIRVIYSGGKGANRADRAILEGIDARQHLSNGGAYFLVTSDADLADRAREKGASVIGAEAFSDLLVVPTL